MNDTICAISTALGVGAISIIRVSGEEAINKVANLFDGKNLNEVKSHTIHYGHIISNGEIIDEVLVTILKAPKTYTKEDIVEINSHGGISTTKKILEILIENGIRLAEPGEFTKRAFLNGRLDLTEAEAVNSLIKSRTDLERKLALNTLSGKVSKKINKVREIIVELLANIEVNIDFPEYEDALEITLENLPPKLNEIKKELENLLEEGKIGKIIENGIKVAIVGRPNVGKSSILNALLKENKAIVTDIAGTTRDIVEGEVELKGIALKFIDTAGIRKTKDVVEKIGVDKSLEMIDESDLVIHVLNNNEVLTEEDKEIMEKIKDKTHITFINKSDLPTKLKIDKKDVVKGNTMDLNGLDELKNKIVELFDLERINNSNLEVVSSAREIGLLNEALNSIDQALNNVSSKLPVDMIAIDIKKAWDLLGEITGESYQDELLDTLFSKFCLGK
ncbi:MAG TPA: tRNA uridine-5-carboxymethylaminomethyl(34) synthesis GTPase MnmE [Candidatus Caccenecus avistercoris]|nr:tRNA uridine-5-carboxymethylaminomethyl(34) synthesis GTPase MnmE [Candidatus Caccenecus avistercoris]